MKYAMLASLVVALVVPGASPARPDGGPRLTACAGALGALGARCGSIRVPLDRTSPSAGTTNIVFALVPRRAKSRPSLGTLVISSGPIIAAGAEYAQGLAPLRARRDLLFVDQRGTGRSGVLTCAALRGVVRHRAAEGPEVARPCDGAVDGVPELLRPLSKVDDVTDARPQGLTEQLRRQLRRDQDGADLRPVADELLGRGQAVRRGAGRAEHGDERDARQPLAEGLDARHRHREVAELHRQATPHRLIRVDDRDGGAQPPDRTGQGTVI